MGLVAERRLSKYPSWGKGDVVSRILAVAGINLDRAWPELGPDLGTVLREWSQALLVHIVEAAHREGADCLVVVGGLFDRASAPPSTVDWAAAVLESFGGQVFVAPGPRDWYGAKGPYEITSWPPNVTVFDAAYFQGHEVADDLMVAGAAWTGPSQGRVAGAELLEPGPRMLLVAHPQHPAPASLASTLPGRGHLLTSAADAAAEQRVTVLGDLVEAVLGSADGVLIDFHSHSPSPRTINLGASPIRTLSLPMEGLDSTDALNDVLTGVAESTRDPLLVELTGRVHVGVLLPHCSGWMPLRPDVVIDDSQLTFEEPPELDERTTKGEFLRAMRQRGTSDRERHQATALGLRALENTG